MVSTYSGTVVRTTHLSGMFTDFGIFLGHAIRASWLGVIIITGFLCGGFAGTLAFHRLSYDALFIPGGVTAITCLTYGLWAWSRQRAAREKP